MDGKGLTCTPRLLADPKQHRYLSKPGDHNSRFGSGLGSGGVTGKPDVEKRQLVAELQ